MQHDNNLKKMANKAAWQVLLVILRSFTKATQFFQYPLIGPKLKKMANLEPGAKSQAYTLNINADVTDAAQGVILPVDMMKQLIRESSYRAIMNQCLCRCAFDCKDFPHNQGCLFIGEGAKGIVKQGQGRKVSVEEALAHIDRGAQLGLIGQAMWLEVERLILGVRHEKDVARWLEICFCCPCCCGTFKMIKNANQADISERFRSIGWKAHVDEESCVACGLCIEKCPVQAITLNNKHLAVDQEKCLGCGFCAARCQPKSIKLHLHAPLLDKVQDYFTNSGLKVCI